MIEINEFWCACTRRQRLQLYWQAYPTSCNKTSCCRQVDTKRFSVTGDIHFLDHFSYWFNRFRRKNARTRLLPNDPNKIISGISISWEIIIKVFERSNSTIRSYFQIFTIQRRISRSNTNTDDVTNQGVYFNRKMKKQNFSTTKLTVFQGLTTG